MSLRIWGATLMAVTSLALADEGTGLRISAAVDTLATGNLSSGNTQPSNIIVRGAEITLTAPADHLFDGTLSFAAHGNENVGVELHEGWIGSTKLIPRSRFRLGQFFLGVGRLNQFHQHDWPFIAAPKVHNDLFAFEGVFDTGLEFTYLLPLPFFLEITAALTNGYVFGHSHVQGFPPKIATNYARLATYLSLPWNGGSQIGLSYIGNRSNQGVDLFMAGLDLTAKWKEMKHNLLFFQSEIWYRDLTQSNGSLESSLGFYVYPEYSLGEDLFLGVRLDYFSILNSKDAAGISLQNVEWNVVPTISYKPSEFVTFRLAYNHRPTTNYVVGTQVQKYIEFQSIFILGAHPAHDF